MGTVLFSDAREDTFEGEKMLFSVLSASLVVLAAGSVLPEERISCSFPPGTCMAWTWSSVSGCKCTKARLSDRPQRVQSQTRRASPQTQRRAQQCGTGMGRLSDGSGRLRA